MNKDLISIIVPVYNSAEFLNKCVDSLLSQQYENIEIILVNDGSKDESEKICLKYESLDQRIQYLYKNNGGASSARNYGLQRAKGKFVTFVDSDDYVGKNYVYDMISAHDGFDDTFVISGMRLKKNNEIGYFTYAPEVVTKENIISDFQTKQFFLHGGPTSKLFNLSIIRQYNIQFNTRLKNYEDLIFCLDYLSHVTKIKYIPSTEYVYALDNMSMGRALNGVEGELLLYDLYNDGLATIDTDYLSKAPKAAMYGNVFLVRALQAYIKASKKYNGDVKNYLSFVCSKMRINDFDISISVKQYLAFLILSKRYFYLLYYFVKTIKF